MDELEAWLTYQWTYVVTADTTMEQKKPFVKRRKSNWWEAAEDKSRGKGGNFGRKDWPKDVRRTLSSRYCLTRHFSSLSPAVGISLRYFLFWSAESRKIAVASHYRRWYVFPARVSLWSYLPQDGKKILVSSVSRKEQAVLLLLYSM